MKLINHYIITRFNIDFDLYMPNKSLDYYKSWFQNRTELFFNYSYPIMNYCKHDFFWLVLFDERIDVEQLSYFKKKDFLNRITFIFTTNFRKVDDINSFVSFSYFHDIPIVTTTLDSDDSLLCNGFSSIIDNSFLNLRSPYLINLEKGYIVNIFNGIFHLKSFPSNPFISLVEYDLPLKTCLQHDHLEMGNIYPVTNIKNSICWVQNIHDNNLLNSVKGIPVFNYSTLPDYLLKFYSRTNLYKISLAFFNFLFIRVLNKIHQFKYKIF